MGTKIKFPDVSKIWILLALLFSWYVLSGQNNALHFDGDYDIVSLTPINDLPLGSDFTVEMLFRSTSTDADPDCSGHFRRLFAMGPDRLEIGECGGILSVVIPPNNLLQSTIQMHDNQWHCISVVVQNGNLFLYFDDNPAPNLYGINIGNVVESSIRLGHWLGSPTLDQDWLGYIDEVKIWNKALGPGELTGCAPCGLDGSEPGLIVYWRLNDGVANGNNTGINQVLDASYHGNLGNLTGFALSGTSSNFVVSSAPLSQPQYKTGLSVLISYPTNPTVLISDFCSGAPLHFTVVDQNMTPVQADANVSISWEYSDDCLNFTPIAPDPPPSAVFSGFSFAVPPNHAATTLDCADYPNAYTVRCYRAIITVTDIYGTCTYLVNPAQVTICCPITLAQVQIQPSLVCEGPVQFSVNLITNLPQPGPNNDVEVEWYMNFNAGPLNPIPEAHNLFTFSPLGFSTDPGIICFQAIIKNCACPPFFVSNCVIVDSLPQCGTIGPANLPGNLAPDPDGNPDHFLICPGNDASLRITSPFKRCTPVWQYMFPSEGIWKDLGTANGLQNLNILPQTHPAGSPYLWPDGETQILYRIKCLPRNYPDSGCEPCYSNIIRVALLPPPDKPVITIDLNPICKGGIAVLSVQNPQPNVLYEWFGNGLFLGLGNPFSTNLPYCFKVRATGLNPSCQSVYSDTLCLTVCEAVAIIGPIDPLCPCVGEPVTIYSTESHSTCGGPLSYHWVWPMGMANTPNITVIPEATGTTYSLTITDQHGCQDTEQITIVPCTQ